MQSNCDKWGAYSPRPSDLFLIYLRRFHLVRGKHRAALNQHLSSRYPALDVTSGGIRYRCRVGDNATETGIVYRGEKQEYHPWRQIRKHLKPGDTFVDVGANCGVYSLRAGNLIGPSGCVLAIEPNPEMVDRLRFNVSANAGKIAVLECAVGAENSKVPLYINAKQLGMCSTVGDGACITVECRTLLDIVTTAKLQRIDALKIDIEGAEDQALIPYLKSAPSNLLPRFIVTETTSRREWRDDLIGALHEAGYQCVWQGNSDAAFHFRDRI